MAETEQPVQEQQPEEAQGGNGGEPQAGPASTDGAGGAPMISKSQMKKLKKRQYYEERKQQRKAAEKQQRLADQERRREEGRQRMAAMNDEERRQWREERNARGVARKQERQEGKARMEKALESGQQIVVDLDFADLMLDSELKSICGQLAYCWHVNCTANLPAHLVLTGVQGKMKEAMDKQVTGYVNWKATVTAQSYLEHFADCKETLVYLTADSDNELQELDPEAIYIIGGIVDRNRHKLLCYNKAVEQGIAHARLPIGDYMRLASSAVMTTNHVCDIMLKWMELRDWKQAFEAVIPNRKRKADDDGGEAQQQQQKRQESAAEGQADVGKEQEQEEGSEGQDAPQQEEQQASEQQQEADEAAQQQEAVAAPLAQQAAEQQAAAEAHNGMPESAQAPTEAAPQS